MVLALSFAGPAVAQTRGESKVRKALALGEPYSALRRCDHELGKDDAPAVFHALRADAHNRIGNSTAALADANAALAAMPTDAYAWLQRGIARSVLGPQDSAIADLERARDIAADPRLVTETLVQLALAHQRAQQPERALAALVPPEGKAHGNAQDPRVFRIKGECEAMLGDTAAARADLDKAIELAPRDPVNWNSRGYHRYARSGEHERALLDYDRAIKLNPNYGYAFNNRGWSRYKLGRKEQALKDITLARRKNPHNAYALRNLGLIALDDGRTEAACRYFSEALAEGFTNQHGNEVQELMNAHCKEMHQAPGIERPVPAINAPGNAPPRTNAP